MSGRPAPATQATIERAIRAAQAAGLAVVGIIARADGYEISTKASDEKSETVVAPDRIPVL